MTMEREAVQVAPRPERLLVISAHPADADAEIAGSVARWIREGTVAHLVCCTSGDAGADAGGGDAGMDPLELAAIREAEQRAAAAIVGYGAVTFLHRPDGALANDLALREQLVRVIRAFRPDAVAAPDPRVIVTAQGVAHADHRAAGAAALDAVDPASENAMAFPHLVRSEGLAPHHVDRLLLFGSERPEAYVDIATMLATKVAALAAHVSQHPDHERIEARVHEEARQAGLAAGLDAAEAWTVIDR